MGVTSRGINRELAATLQCGSIFQLLKMKPLGRAREAIIRLASLIPPAKEPQERYRMIGITGDEKRYPTWNVIAKGLLPTLLYVLKQEKIDETDPL